MSHMAYVEIDGVLLPDVCGPMRDAGLRIVGSLPNDRDGQVRLLIEGVPRECAGQHVLLEFERETYGLQRMTKLSRISVRP
ncbi:MAG: hypothetical protein HOQ20_10955 [Bradyrhizobium sp.]|nr:hypothetical protein [Bradyrhizobium sp.]